MKATVAALKLHGISVPIEKYARLERLAGIVYGYFDVKTDDRKARRESVRIAMEMEGWITARVLSAESARGGR